MAGPLAVIGQGNGGLVARRFLIDHPTTTRIARLVTYGTPHLGADYGYWCNAAAIPAVQQLGGMFGRLVAALGASGGCANPTAVGGVRDVTFTCVNGEPQTSAFLDDLNGATLPPSIAYSSIAGVWGASGWNAGVLPQGGVRALDCQSQTWDGLAPVSSQVLPVPNGRSLESERFTETEGNDLSTIFCGLNTRCQVIRMTGPVEMTVSRDSDARKIARQLSEIPGAAFMTKVVGVDETVFVTLPLAASGEQYTVTVTPRAGASGTYTFGVAVGGGPATTTVHAVPAVSATHTVNVP
jgi:hypothetical protein